MCDLISYGTNIVASVDRKYETIVRNYIEKYPVEHCFETPDLHVLNEAFLEHGMKVCFMAEYFLPDMNQLRKLPCRYEMRVLGPEDFRDLYTEQWSNALCEQRKELDMVGVGAYQDGRLIAWRALRRTVKKCGRSVLMCFRKSGDRELRARLQARLRWKFFPAEKCLLLLRLGRI